MLLLPLLVALYLWLLARRRKTTLRLASVAVAKSGRGQRARAGGAMCRRC
jgi:Ca-activated chloride channel family protein